MARTSDPQAPRPRHLKLLPNQPPLPATPLPAVVPLLRPDHPVTPAQDALLTAIARRAQAGDRAARDLLWRAIAPRLEPALRRCGRVFWQRGWARRDGQPWDLEDLRQEGWFVFQQLITDWDGEGSFIPFATAYFPWRLRNAMRRLSPSRQSIARSVFVGPAVECRELLDADGRVLLAAIVATLSPADAVVLHMRVMDDLGLAEIARHLGVSRRVVTRRWARIRRVARALLRDSGQHPPGGGEAIRGQ